MKRYFISGTDTGVGKTAVTAALASYLCDNGFRTSCMKPLQSGALLDGTEYRSGDADFVFQVAGSNLLPKKVEERCPYLFLLPASPHLAAAEEGKEVRISDVLVKVGEVEEATKPQISLIEGAGGLAVPINEDEIMFDLAAELSAEVILVVRPNLGTINHTFLSLQLLKSRGLKLAALVVSNWPDEPSLIERDNLRLVTQYAGSAPVLKLPTIEGLDTESLATLPSGWNTSFNAELKQSRLF